MELAVNKRKQEVKAYFNHIAHDLRSYRSSRKYYWNSIAEYCNFFIHDEDSVLQIGCANGDLLAALKGSKKTGFDFSDQMIAEAKKNHSEINFFVDDIETSVHHEKYDVIVLSNLVGFLVDIETAFNKLNNLCHPQTRIIISHYNFVWEPFIRFAESFGIKKAQPYQSWLSMNDIKNLMYLSGFDVYRTKNHLLFPYRIPIISTLLNKYIGHLPLIGDLGMNQFVMARPIAKELSEEELNQKYSVSIVIPARNESGNIEDAILRLPKFGKFQEIIFIEGNSTDDTWIKIQEIAEKYKSTHRIKIGQQPGKGKGDAVRMGYDMSEGDMLMILDADLTVPPEDLPKFYNALASGKAEFINGSRLVYPMEKNAMRPLNALGNKFFSIAFSWLLEQPIKDTLCGTKVLLKKDYERLKKNRTFFGEFDPFGDFDLIFGAYKLNLKIIDLPIRYQERIYGTTNISRFKHGWLLLKMVFFAMGKIKFR
jgi:ubiquinone/menaquinone biosynthesis C-methylase UbiE